MDGSSQEPASRGKADAGAAGVEPSRLRGFAIFQLIFWGAFLVIRAAASALYYPEVFWAFMGPRIVAVLAYVGATTLIHLLVSRLRAWTPARRLALTIGLCALAMYPLHEFEALLTASYAPNWPVERFIEYLTQYGWVLLAWAGYYYAQDHANEVKRQAIALTHAQALAHAAQMKMLRYQLNPHFLFNSLNAVSTLVLEQRNVEAEAMLLKLSSFLRHTIDTDPTQLARLGEEAQLQRLYLEMEAVRFGDRMQVFCTVPAELHDCLVPSLLLQPIVENAIKHGVAKGGDGGRIAIEASEQNGRLCLIVENEGPPFIPGEDAQGVGLRNTEERLQTIYGNKARFAISARTGGGARVVFDLPLQRAS